MAQRMDKTTITKLLRISWEAVAKTVVDVVADHLDADLDCTSGSLGTLRSRVRMGPHGRAAEGGQ